MSAKTEQVDVAPGDETGIYHITFANLPFHTPWRRFKEWLSSVCVVDYVRIFDDSTCGWARLHGVENFQKGWDLLNGGEFRGRPIMASDQNKTETIKIRQPIKKSKRAKNKALQRPTPSPELRSQAYIYRPRGMPRNPPRGPRAYYTKKPRPQPHGGFHLPSSIVTTGATTPSASPPLTKATTAAGLYLNSNVGACGNPFQIYRRNRYQCCKLDIVSSEDSPATEAAPFTRSSTPGVTTAPLIVNGSSRRFSV